MEIMQVLVYRYGCRSAHFLITPCSDSSAFTLWLIIALREYMDAEMVNFPFMEIQVSDLVIVDVRTI